MSASPAEYRPLARNAPASGTGLTLQLAAGRATTAPLVMSAS